MATKKKTKRTWKPTIGAKLGPQEQKLRDLLKLRGQETAAQLFRAITGSFIDKRKMHQRIGAIAARYNKKVKTPRIVTGLVAGTYRLRRLR